MEVYAAAAMDYPADPQLAALIRLGEHAAAVSQIGAALADERLSPRSRVHLRMWRGIVRVLAAERGEDLGDASDDLRAAAGAEEAAPDVRATALVYTARSLLARRDLGAAEAYLERFEEAARGCSGRCRAQGPLVRAGLELALARGLPPGSPGAGRAHDRVADLLEEYARLGPGREYAEGRFGRLLAASLRRTAGADADDADRRAELEAAHAAAEREWDEAPAPEPLERAAAALRVGARRPA